MNRHPALPDNDCGARQGVLLHACCAPCSAAILEAMDAEGTKPVVFFSNSNIYPHAEYEKRRDELARLTAAAGLELVEDEYDHRAWLDAVAGLEDEPERGARCLQCFRFRLRRAADYAASRGLTVLTTTLASSRWKDLEQIAHAGADATQSTGGVSFWNRNWRRGGLTERRAALLRLHGFYNQQYCGCEFSRIQSKNRSK